MAPCPPTLLDPPLATSLFNKFSIHGIRYTYVAWRWDRFLMWRLRALGPPASPLFPTWSDRRLLLTIIQLLQSDTSNVIWMIPAISGLILFGSGWRPTYSCLHCMHVQFSGVTHCKHWFWVKLALVTFVSTSTTAIDNSTICTHWLTVFCFFLCGILSIFWCCCVTARRSFNLAFVQLKTMHVLSWF